MRYCFKDSTAFLITKLEWYMLNNNEVSVPEFIELVKNKLDVNVVLDAGIDERSISDFVIIKPGLALAGFQQHIHAGRAMLFGKTEIEYLATIPHEQAYSVLKQLFEKNSTCIIVSKSLPILDVLKQAAIDTNLPILTTSENSRNTITSATSVLEAKLSKKAYIHGVFMDVYGIGVLITGKSGIGKSECAIELIKRGHRLVADDVVVGFIGNGRLQGTADDLLRYHIELRGLGIVNVRDMFGITSIRVKKRIEFAINFITDSLDNSDRLGMKESYKDILGIKVPEVTCEILPGRNMAVIVEIAARNYLLKAMGYDSSKAFILKADERLKIK